MVVGGYSLARGNTSDRTGLDQPPFTPGSGAVTIQVGTRCFTDSADACTLNSAATAASCD
jgi:hypothetical protein